MAETKRDVAEQAYDWAREMHQQLTEMLEILAKNPAETIRTQDALEALQPIKQAITELLKRFAEAGDAPPAGPRTPTFGDTPDEHEAHTLAAVTAHAVTELRVVPVAYRGRVLDALTALMAPPKRDTTADFLAALPALLSILQASMAQQREPAEREAPPDAADEDTERASFEVTATDSTGKSHIVTINRSITVGGRHVYELGRFLVPCGSTSAEACETCVQALLDMYVSNADDDEPQKH